MIAEDMQNGDQQMQIDLRNYNIDEDIRKGVAQLATILNPTDGIVVSLRARQVAALFGGAVETEEEAPAAKAPAAKAQTQEPAEDKGEPKIRRTKEEMEAGLTLEQARDFRSSRMSLEDYLASTGPEDELGLDETPPPVTGANQVDDELGEAPAMSKPVKASETHEEITLDNVRVVVGRFMDAGRQQEVKDYTKSIGLARLRDATPDRFEQIVADLEAIEVGTGGDVDELL